MADTTISQLTQGTPTTGIVLPYTDGTTTYQAKLSSLITATGDMGAGGIQLPIGTTDQRPIAPTNGMMRFNSTKGSLEVYYGGTWLILASTTITATGGNSIVTTGGYKYHTFTSSGTFTVTSGVGGVDFLVVAGGGSGGGHNGGLYEGGGGGAKVYP